MTGRRVLAVTTDACFRQRECREARCVALTQLIDAGVDRVYLKIDSTLRGSVPGRSPARSLPGEKYIRLLLRSCVQPIRLWAEPSLRISCW